MKIIFNLYLALAVFLTSWQSHWNGNHDQTIFQSPVESLKIQKYYQPPPKPWMSGNRGLDLEVKDHTPIYAPQGGEVKLARRIVDRNVVTIWHSNGVTTTFTHISALVSEGELVSKGQLIGYSDGTMIEWGAKTGPKQYINPLILLLPPPRLVAD